MSCNRDVERSVLALAGAMRELAGHTLTLEALVNNVETTPRMAEMLGRVRAALLCLGFDLEVQVDRKGTTEDDDELVTEERRYG